MLERENTIDRNYGIVNFQHRQSKLLGYGGIAASISHIYSKMLELILSWGSAVTW